MHIFQSQGFVISVGFDPTARTVSPNSIFWSDPTTKEWEASAGNQAGFTIFKDIVLDPEFVRERPRGFFIYQPRICIEAELVGAPFIWRFVCLRPKQ